MRALSAAAAAGVGAETDATALYEGERASAATPLACLNPCHEACYVWVPSRLLPCGGFMRGVTSLRVVRWRRERGDVARQRGCHAPPPRVRMSVWPVDAPASRRVGARVRWTA